MLLKNIKKQKGFNAEGLASDVDVENKLREHGVHPRVIDLLKLPQYEQRTPEWFDQRKGKLTASDLDAVCGNNKYQSKTEVLFKKNGVSPPFTGNVATRHGQKYEDEAIELYCKQYNKRSFDFGLLPHPSIGFLAGSPDGITWDGIVIEVKCPLRRKIVKGEIPEHYKGQVFINMEIANLDRAAFIEYKPKELSDTGEIELNVVHIDRDPNWFPSILPVVEGFWSEVNTYKEKGIESHPEYAAHYRKANPVVECHSDPDGFDATLNPQDG